MDQSREDEKKLDRHLEAKLSRADLLDESIAPGWAKKHVVTPFVHSAFYEPAAIVLGKSFKETKPSTASYLNEQNSASSSDSGAKKPDSKEQAASHSSSSNSLTETVVEIVSGAAGAGIVYAVAGKGAGAFFRAGAQKGLLGNTLPKYVATENGSMITGAAIYDTARHPNDGETRFGNAVAGAASFAVFIKGNALTSELNTAMRIASLPVIGAVGGLVQKQISVGIAQERMINRSEFGEAVLGGAVINTVLPGATKAISMGIDHINTKSGRGVPVERMAKEKGWLSKSNELDALIYANPYARVRFDAQLPNSLNSRTATITLNVDSPAKLGHELKHLELRKQDGFDAPYESASRSLQDGYNSSAEKQFLKARENEETQAIKTENSIASQLGLPELSSSISIAQRNAWSNQWQWFKHTEGKEKPSLDFSIGNSTQFKLGESKELATRAREISKNELETQEKATHWYPEDYHEGLTLADAQFIQKSIEQYPYLYDVLETRIQDSQNQVFRAMAMDVLNGRARISKEADLVELQDYAHSTIRTAENHFDDVARTLDTVFDVNVWDDAPHAVKREFRNAEDAQAYGELYAKLKHLDGEEQLQITPRAVQAITEAGMSTHPPELLLKIVDRNDLANIVRSKPDASQLAKATEVWKVAPTLSFELALELHGRTTVELIAADKAWRTVTEKLYMPDKGRSYGMDPSLSQHLNLFATNGDRAVFQAEWKNLQEMGTAAVLTSSPAYFGETVKHFLGDKFPPAQIEQLINNLHFRTGSKTDSTANSKAIADLNQTTLMQIYERLKVSTKDLNDYEAVREHRELSAASQAVIVTAIFGERAGAYLDSLQTHGISFQKAIDRLYINTKESNKEFADWYFANSEKSIADRHRVAVFWDSLTPEQRKQDFSRLEQTVLSIAAQKSKGIGGLNEEGYAIMRELDVAKLHPEMDGPLRRAAIVGMSGYTTSTYAAEQALSATINGRAFEHALAKLGLPHDYRMMWSDLSRGGKPNEGGVLPDTAKRAVVLSSIFGDKLPTWYDVQQTNGRGPLTASNIVPFAWTEGLTKPIRIGKDGKQQEIRLSELLFHNANKSIAEIANLVKGWEHFQVNAKRNEVDLSAFSSIDQLTKEIQRNALKAGGESNFALTKSKLGEWPGYHRGSPNNDFVDPLPKSTPSETQVRDAIKAADPEILLKVSRQFGDDATMLYDFARASQILSKDVAAGEAGKMPALPLAASDAGGTPVPRAAAEVGGTPSLAGAATEVGGTHKVVGAEAAIAGVAKSASWSTLLDAPLPNAKARDFLFDIFDLQRRLDSIPSDPRAWSMYFNNKQLTTVDREILIRNWNQIPEHLKDAPGREAARFAFTALSPKITESVRAELGAKELKEWERVAANNAWTAAKPVNDFAFGPGKREVTYNDRAAEFWNKTFPEQLAKGQEANYAQAGTAHVVHALYKHLNGQQRTALAAAYEIEFKKRGVLSSDSKLELIKDLKANSFFDNVKSAGLQIEDIGSNRLQQSVKGEYQFAAALRLAQIFGARSGEWLSARSKMNENFHDATEYLPFLTKRESSGLSDFLLKHSKHNAEEIRVVAAGWESLTPQERALPIAEIVKTIRSRSYPNAKNSEFAIEAARWAVPESEYYQMESRFEASKSVASPFPTDKVFTSESGLKGFFMRRDDPRGLFLGHHTNSCQHPQGDAASAAWYGQESPNSGFFVVTNSKNEVIAMSWAVVSENKLLFDNVEAKGLGTRGEEVRQIYRSAAKDLISSGKVSQVNLGTQHGDLPTNGMPPAKADDMIKLPADYLAMDGYSDAATQVVIAR